MDPMADSLTPASIAFPTLAFIAILLDIPPLVWHAKNRNVAACNLISWTILVNLCNFVNALIWPTDNVSTWFTGYVLCDIEAKILLAATVGISGSLACIMRALAKVLDTENSVMIPTKKQRYQELAITALLCFGTPIYILYELYRNASHPLLPYSWDLIHAPSTWMNIIMVPQHGVVPLDRWMPIILGILIFVFFGMGSDATRMYRKWWLKLRPGTSSPGPYGQPAASRMQSSNFDQDKGSLASLLSTFCRKRFSWRRLSTSQLEKHHTATTITTLASPTESEKMSRAQDPALMTSPTNTSASTTLATEDRPLPPVPAQSKPSWLKKHFLRPCAPSPPDDIDIESALERYDNHRPNRFISGLWHANNATNSAPMPATHMGNCNGLSV
ncbi:MAG: hypothetical protein Q9197_005937 [Variospora fuerteventurae]